MITPATHLANWTPGLLSSAAGATIAVAGFMIMRNPFVICRMPFARKGYYQRLFLDTTNRNQFRAMGGFMSLFGILFLLAGSHFFHQSSVVDALIKSFYEVLAIATLGGFAVGVILLVVDLIRGRLIRRIINSWKLLYSAARLEELPVPPEITPNIRLEARIFTIVFAGALVVGIVRAITRI